MNHYCFTCMEEIPEGSFCPHCHKENTPEEYAYRLKPGTILDGKYLVGNCLGEGGFGITYIGRDLSLDIKVAIKEYFPNGYVNRNHTLDSTVTAGTESQKQFFYKGKERFLEEARKVAKFLGEPGIVGIREYFEANGTAYIIMEYLEGENLSAYIKHHGNFDAVSIFKLMLPITRSLKRVHDTGLIHRDISPDNIMYLATGKLKLMDFGSARYFTNEQKEMSVLLKKGYAPEEQYRKTGKQGPWTDVYGLCATIYRCITGNIPADALDRLREDMLTPPSQLGIAIPPALENILMYGMAVLQEKRCQNMEELSSLIELALTDPQKAQEVTARLRFGEQQQPKPYQEDDEERTVLVDDGNKSVKGEGFDVEQRKGFLPPDPDPYKNGGIMGDPPFDPGYAPAPKKKKTGLIVGLIVGIAVVVIGVIVTVVIINNNKNKPNPAPSPTTPIVTEAPSVDGSYVMSHYYMSGTDYISFLNDTYTLTVSNNKGTLRSSNGSTETWSFDTQTNIVTVVQTGDTYPFTLSGNTLTIEDTKNSAQLLFER